MAYLDIRDLTEITAIALIIFSSLIWLGNDEKKRLLYAFYAYCLSVFISYFANLTVLYTILIFSLPILLLISILFHQRTLQKNFISFIKAPIKNNTSWLTEFIKCTLISLNNNKETTYVIECSDDLKEFIKIPMLFNADLTTDIFSILLEKHINSPNYIILLDQTGKLIATNAYWNPIDYTKYTLLQTKSLDAWHKLSLVISSKTDAIIFKGDPITRSFDFIAQGKLFEKINIDQLASLISLYLDKTSKTKLDYSINEKIINNIGKTIEIKNNQL